SAAGIAPASKPPHRSIATPRGLDAARPGQEQIEAIGVPVASGKLEEERAVEPTRDLISCTSGQWRRWIVATVLIPIPSKDFDPTEVAVSWKVLKRLGHSVVFATPAGREGSADDIMLTGEGPDLWGFLPGLRRLVAFGRMARANADARRAYAEMRKRPSILANLLVLSIVAPIIVAGSNQAPMWLVRRDVSRRQKPTPALDHRAHSAALQFRQ